MEDPFENAESIMSAQSEGVEEALEHYKSILHDLRLQDAIYRQKIRKLENQNYQLDKVEKSKSGEDEQYLMKQQEMIVTLEMAEEIPGERATEIETFKDRLKFKNTSLKRAKNLQSNLREAAYKTQCTAENIAELYNNIARVESMPDNNKPTFVKDLMVKLINSLESLESQSVQTKANNTSVASSKNESKTTTKGKGKQENTKAGQKPSQGAELKTAKLSTFDDGIFKVSYIQFSNFKICILTYQKDNQALRGEISDLERRDKEIKRLRVNAQKQIFNIEKKLNYIENELADNQLPEVENLEDLDLNKEATATNSKTNEILKNLREKLEGVSTGDKMETRFIKEL